MIRVGTILALSELGMLLDSMIRGGKPLVGLIRGGTRMVRTIRVGTKLVSMGKVLVGMIRVDTILVGMTKILVSKTVIGHHWVLGTILDKTGYIIGWHCQMR